MCQIADCLYPAYHPYEDKEVHPHRIGIEPSAAGSYKHQRNGSIGAGVFVAIQNLRSISWGFDRQKSQLREPLQKRSGNISVLSVPSQTRRNTQQTRSSKPGRSWWSYVQSAIQSISVGVSSDNQMCFGSWYVSPRHSSFVHFSKIRLVNVRPGIALFRADAHRRLRRIT